jgi:hypothetical protein
MYLLGVSFIIFSEVMPISIVRFRNYQPLLPDDIAGVMAPQGGPLIPQ